MGSDDLRRAFRTASRDENVEAIVLRIDSPGGSALASEAMWQAARRLAGDKPYAVLEGDLSAHAEDHAEKNQQEVHHLARAGGDARDRIKNRLHANPPSCLLPEPTPRIYSPKIVVSANSQIRWHTAMWAS